MFITGTDSTHGQEIQASLSEIPAIKLQTQAEAIQYINTHPGTFLILHSISAFYYGQTYDNLRTVIFKDAIADFTSIALRKRNSTVPLKLMDYGAQKMHESGIVSHIWKSYMDERKALKIVTDMDQRGRIPWSLETVKTYGYTMLAGSGVGIAALILELLKI